MPYMINKKGELEYYPSIDWMEDVYALANMYSTLGIIPDLSQMDTDDHWETFWMIKLREVTI